MKLFEKPERRQLSGAEMREKEAAAKRALTFIILVLMIMSLTMCKTPTYEEFMEGMEEQSGETTEAK